MRERQCDPMLAELLGNARYAHATPQSSLVQWLPNAAMDIFRISDKRITRIMRRIRDLHDTIRIRFMAQFAFFVHGENIQRHWEKKNAAQLGI